MKSLLEFIAECKTHKLVGEDSFHVKDDDLFEEVEWSEGDMIWTISIDDYSNDPIDVYIHVSNISTNSWWELFTLCSHEGVAQFSTFKDKINGSCQSA